MDQVGIEKARTSLGELVDRARFTGEPATITRQGKRVAVLVSSDWYDRAEALMAKYGESEA
jgi:prevent-host-death family protein